MATLASLIVNISANTAKLTSGLAGASSSAGKFAGTVAKYGAAAGVALAGVGIAAGKMAVDFEAQMSNVGTLLGKEGSGRVKELGEDVKRLAQQTGKPLQELSGGLYQAVSALGDGADTAKILEIAAMGAAAGLADTGSVVNLLAGTMKGYGTVNAEAAQKVSDLAFQTVKLGVTTMPELAATMGRVVPLASTLGVNMESLFGAMATLTGVTGNTAEVSTQLRATIQALMKPTADMTELLKLTGFASGEAAIKSLGFQGTLDKLKEAAGGNQEALAKAFGSVESLGAVLALTGSQAATFTEKTKAMTNANGASAEAFKIQQGSVKAMLDRLKQTLSVVMVNLGEQFLPMLNRMGAWVQQHMPQIQAFFQRAFDIMGTGFRLIGDVVNWFIRNVVSPLVERWRSSQGDIQDQFGATWEWIKRVAGLIWGVISKYVELWTVIWREWGDEFMAIVRIAWNTIGTVIEAALKIIGGILDFFIGLFTGDWQRMADGFKAIFSGLWDGIKAIVSGAWGIIKVAFGGLWDAISGWFVNLKQDFIAWGGNVIDGFKQGIADKIQAVKDTLNNLWSSITDGVKAFFGISSPSKLMQGFGSNIGQGLALGIKDQTSAVQSAITDPVLTALQNSGLVDAARKAGVEIGNALGGSVSEATTRVTNQINASRAQEGLPPLGLVPDEPAPVDPLRAGIEAIVRSQTWQKSIEEGKRFLEGGGNFFPTDPLRNMRDMALTGMTKQLAAQGVAISQSVKDVINKMSEAQLKNYLKAFQIPGFAEGGVVSGSIGSPRLAVVHGGERVLTPAQQRGGGAVQVTNVFQGPVYGVLDLDRRITQTVRDAIQGGAFRGVIATP